MWTYIIALLVAALALFLLSKVHKALQLKGFKGPKYSFPDGNIRLLRSYPHVAQAFLEFSKQFGSMYRLFIGPFTPIVICSDPESVRHIFVTYKDQLGLPPRPELLRVTGNSLLTTQGETWKRQRTLLNPAFHFDKLKNMVGIFQKCLPSFMELLTQHATKGHFFDISELYPKLTMQIIGLSAFDVDLSALSEETSPLAENFRTIASSDAVAQRLSNVIFAIFPFLQRFKASARRTAKAIDAVRSLATKIVTERLNEAIERERQGEVQDDEQPENLIGLLVSCKDEKGNHLPIEEIVDQSMAFLIAGHETTATLMTWFTYALSQNSQVDAKLAQELRDKLSDRPPSYEEATSLEYLNSCIDETLRITPPVPIVGRLTLQDIQLGDHIVPKGFMVLAPCYLLHHNPEIFEEPDSFKPERFAKEVAKRHRFSFFPFSLGHRHCIGQNFALLEAKVLLSHIFRRFRFVLEPNHDPKPIVSIIMRPTNGIRVKVIERD